MVLKKDVPYGAQYYYPEIEYYYKIEEGVLYAFDTEHPRDGWYISHLLGGLSTIVFCIKNGDMKEVKND